MGARVLINGTRYKRRPYAEAWLRPAHMVNTYIEIINVEYVAASRFKDI